MMKLGLAVGSGAFLAVVSACGSGSPNAAPTDATTSTSTATGSDTVTGTGATTSTTTGSSTIPVTTTFTGTGVTTPGVCAAGTIGSANVCAALNTGASMPNTNVDVSVTAVGAVPTSAGCSGSGAQRLTLAGPDGGVWTLDLNITGLPSAFVQPGDKLGIAVASWTRGISIGTPPPSQSLVVVRGGTTILVTYTETGSALSRSALLAGTGSGNNGGAPTSVSVGGISLASASIQCSVTGGFCDLWHHQAKVTVAGSTATVGAGQSASVGGMEVVLKSYYDAVDTGMCDGFSYLTFAAFTP